MPTDAGTDASAVVVIPLGHLYLRGFQRWVASLSLDHSRKGLSECVVALHQWKLNTSIVTYINRQGELWSPQLYTLAHSLIMWSSVHHLSLRHTPPGTLELLGRLAFQR